MKFRKLFDNEAGVSPIVATLVLIVVAIAGAAAVGTILGSFSSDVSSETSSEVAAAGASTQIVVGGSTSVAPLAESLKSGFEKDRPGTKIVVQEGGDSAGVIAVGMGVLDIGLISRELTHAEKDKYHDLQTQWIGSSAVVIIGGEEVRTKFVSGKSELTNADLKKLYGDAFRGGTTYAHNLTYGNASVRLETASADNITVYRRAETRSGPEYVFSKYIADGDGDFIAGTRAVAVTGDRGMLEAIAKDPNGLGFVDFRFALEAEKEGMDIHFIGVKDDTCAITSGCVKDTKHMMSHVKGALNGKKMSDGTEMYPLGLLNNMYMVTNGWPSSTEALFINYAQQPSSMSLYTNAGYFSLLEISGAAGKESHSH
ncbi:MAG: substrate-binding domain-containing protein [Methanolobus sp.]|uniref:substrate-binding domain-containing protein n=1 Tax=Methanolobus sp. TaxID=1874737 RepID=UPI002730115E|nr:substrate-binding domain-containing protein [Methanolobus sp.]MDP2216331.1 substrate-binding domain-containing protein [Methanolobus sp.]